MLNEKEKAVKMQEDRMAAASAQARVLGVLFAGRMLSACKRWCCICLHHRQCTRSLACDIQNHTCNLHAGCSLSTACQEA